MGGGDAGDGGGNRQADLLIIGHMSACDCYFCVGELDKALEHADRVMNLYDDEKHRHLADHPQSRSQNSCRCLRFGLHMDAGLPGPGAAAEQ